MFLLFLATNEVFTRRSEILKLRDEKLQAAHRDGLTFIPHTIQSGMLVYQPTIIHTSISCTRLRDITPTYHPL